MFLFTLSCWMSIEGGMMYSFIIPVSLLIMVNHDPTTTQMTSLIICNFIFRLTQL